MYAPRGRCGGVREERVKGARNTARGPADAQCPAAPRVNRGGRGVQGTMRRLGADAEAHVALGVATELDVANLAAGNQGGVALIVHDF